MKKLRAWWNRNSTQITKDVKTVEEAIKWINEQAELDLKDNNIIWNAGGLEEFEDGEWSEYYNEDGLDIKEIIEEIEELENA